MNNSISSLIEEKVTTTSTASGVYLMKNASGDIIYVGKAKNLRKRLSSYFLKKEHADPKTDVLIRKIHAFDTIITAHEDEALLLESTLIKKHRPRYNIQLKDDKRYPLIRLDLTSNYPYLSIVRKSKPDGAMYFGPFPSSQSVRETLRTINKVFKIRKCRHKEIKSRTRPCLNYQIKTCLAPCCYPVTSKEYQKIVQEIILFLKGRTPALVKQLKKKMLAYADKQDFENAAVIRDRMRCVEKILEKQVAVTSSPVDWDVVGLAENDQATVFTVMAVRRGRLANTRHYYFSKGLSTVDEMMESFIRQYYENLQLIPQTVIVSIELGHKDSLERYLEEVKSKKVHLIHPFRGEKRRLAALANENAKNELTERETAQNKVNRALANLQKALKLSQLPKRIECFDNSNISGSIPVASRSVFIDGQPETSAYRKYHIKTVEGPDDYASMKEILFRRFKNNKESYPDVLMVDGGRGQLSIAENVLKEIIPKREFCIIGIAKKKPPEKKDKIYIPKRINPINISDDALYLLQQIRDESHRFAIQFHRQQRQKKQITSFLDEIPGIGPKRKKILIAHFGSVQKIKQARIEDFEFIKGISKKQAEEIVKKFDNTY
ncbi:excinuclease ABC subunit C [Candidatus Magnetomorum sp. HK-1]|nr:excinuclease ABC subunit C [Candidatus Magnetomorum sp. HK-1]